MCRNAPNGARAVLLVPGAEGCWRLWNLHTCGPVLFAGSCSPGVLHGGGAGGGRGGAASPAHVFTCTRNQQGKPVDVQMKADQRFW